MHPRDAFFTLLSFLFVVADEARVPLQAGLLALEELQSGIKGGTLVGMVNNKTIKLPPGPSRRVTEDYGIAAQTAFDSMMRVTKLMDEFLSLAKIEDGKLELNKVSFSVREWLTNTVSLFSSAVRKKKVKLRLLCAKGVPNVVHADDNRLGQVLSNFLSNAIKFSPSKSTITVFCTITWKRPAVAVEVLEANFGGNSTKEAHEDGFSIESRKSNGSIRTVGGIGGTSAADDPRAASTSFRQNPDVPTAVSSSLSSASSSSSLLPPISVHKQSASSLTSGPDARLALLLEGKGGFLLDPPPAQKNTRREIELVPQLPPPSTSLDLLTTVKRDPRLLSAQRSSSLSSALSPSPVAATPSVSPFVVTVVGQKTPTSANGMRGISPYVGLNHGAITSGASLTVRGAFQSSEMGSSAESRQSGHSPRYAAVAGDHQSDDGASHPSGSSRQGGTGSSGRTDGTKNNSGANGGLGTMKDKDGFTLVPHLYISVHDEGRGLSPEEVSKLFQPYGQLRAGDWHQGTGLGLVFCRQIINLCRGSVGVESKKGKGSIFFCEVLLQGPPGDEDDDDLEEDQRQQEGGRGDEQPGDVAPPSPSAHSVGSSSSSSSFQGLLAPSVNSHNATTNTYASLKGITVAASVGSKNSGGLSSGGQTFRLDPTASSSTDHLNPSQPLPSHRSPAFASMPLDRIPSSGMADERMSSPSKRLQQQQQQQSQKVIMSARRKERNWEDSSHSGEPALPLGKLLLSSSQDIDESAPILMPESDHARLMTPNNGRQGGAAANSAKQSTKAVGNSNHKLLKSWCCSRAPPSPRHQVPTQPPPRATRRPTRPARREAPWGPRRILHCLLQTSAEPKVLSLGWRRLLPQDPVSTTTTATA
jgi:signal transduction histidine kinase